MKKRTYGTGTVREIEVGKWELRYRPKGSRRLSKVVDAPNKKKAEEALTDWRRELDRLGNPGVAVPMTRLFNLHLADLRREKRDARGIQITRQRIDKHLIPFFGKRDATSIGKTDIRRYVDKRIGARAEPATINRELAALRRSFNVGVDEGLVSPLSFRIKPLKEQNVRKGFIEREAYLAIMRHLPSHQHMLFCFAYHLGIRKGELLEFRWSWLLPYWGEEDPIIKIPGEYCKSGEPHTVPIYSVEMRAFVETAMTERNARCPFLFQYQGRGLKSNRSGWQSACIAAGVPGLIFHDTRRTAIRLMEQAGIPRAEAMQITGHKTESVYKRYDIASEKGAIDTGRRMRDFMQSRASSNQTEFEKLGEKLGDKISRQASNGSSEISL